MRRKPGNLRHRFKTPNGASRRSAQAPAAAQYTPPQRQQPHYYTTTAATQCGRIRYAPAASASRRKMRPAATHAGETNHRLNGAATTQCGRIRYAPAASASRRKMRPAATHACKTNRRRTRTHYKVKGDAFRHLLFHNPRLRTRSQSPATAISPNAGKG